MKGPVPTAKVLSLLRAGTLQPTDQVARVPAGPWTPLRQVTWASGTDVVVVETFEVRRTLLGGAFVATYDCPKCRAALQSEENEFGQIETCPTCGLRFRMSPAALRAVTEQRSVEARKKIEAAAAVQAARERKEAARKEALEQRERDRLATADAERWRHNASEEEERARVREAMAARTRTGTCWYCGTPSITAIRQCVACRMVPQ